MVIRPATVHDSATIRSLLIQLGYPNLNEKSVAQKIESYSQQNYHLLVAQLDLAVVGFISLHWFEIFHSPGKIGRITAFCIDERFRSQNIGSELLVASENFLVQQGCSKIEVTSNIRRDRSHDFYWKQGYLEDSKKFTKYPK